MASSSSLFVAREQYPLPKILLPFELTTLRFQSSTFAPIQTQLMTIALHRVARISLIDGQRYRCCRSNCYCNFHSLALLSALVLFHLRSSSSSLFAALVLARKRCLSLRRNHRRLHLRPVVVAAAAVGRRVRFATYLLASVFRRSSNLSTFV